MTIIEIFQGKFSRKFLLTVILPLMMLSYGVLMYWAISYFPGDFRMTTHYISNGGSPFSNPDGWIIWSIAHSLNGVFMAPAVMYLARTIEPLKSASKAESRGFIAGKRLLLISSLGWVTMGLIPQYHGDIWSFLHGLNAALLLGGYCFGMFSWCYYLFHYPNYARWKAILTTIVSFAVPIAFLIIIPYGMANGLSISEAVNDETPAIMRIQTWEWAMMIGIYVSFLVLQIITPEKKN